MARHAKRRWQLPGDPGRRLYEEALAVRLGRSKLPALHQALLEEVGRRSGVAPIHACLLHAEDGGMDLVLVLGSWDDLDRWSGWSERAVVPGVLQDLVRAHPDPSAAEGALGSGGRIRAVRADHVGWYAGTDAFRSLKAADPGYRDAVQGGVHARGFEGLGGDGPHFILFFDRNIQAQVAEAEGWPARVAQELFRRVKPHDAPGWVTQRSVTVSTQTREQHEHAESVGRG